jgi:hypothetical protein
VTPRVVCAIGPKRRCDAPEFAAPHNAGLILDAVERWAHGAWMIRETELIVGGQQCEIPGRLDALLIPLSLSDDAPLARATRGWAWSARRLFGVEVKVTRSDFLRGLREGQLQRYAEGLGGLYLATPHGLVEPDEVPREVGLLSVRRDGYASRVASCVRRAKVRDVQPSPEMLWKILHEVWLRTIAERKSREERLDLALERFGRGAARLLREVAEPRR